MTESKWLTGTDLHKMLIYLLGKTGDRKLRLFACACVRRIWPLLTDPRSRAAVEVAERYADHEAGVGSAQLRVARALARGAALEFQDPIARSAAWAAEATVQDTGYDVARHAATAAALARNPQARVDPTQCDLLRDLFGNPFRPAPIDPRWLEWDGGCVRRIAEVIYTERREGDLPILGDALEEAGCDNLDILDHCRSEMEHVRGCWVVDAVLGKR